MGTRHIFFEVRTGLDELHASEGYTEEQMRLHLFRMCSYNSIILTGSAIAC